MPLSFYHGFEAAAPLSMSKYSEQMQRLLAYLDTLADAQIQDDTDEAPQNFSLRLETRLIRGKEIQGMGFRWTDDPSDPSRCSPRGRCFEDISVDIPSPYRQPQEAIFRLYREQFLSRHPQIARRQ